MARYNGPVCRLCRRLGDKLYLKGEKCFSPKCAFERRPFAPGQRSMRRRKVSDRGLQLREKQRARAVYGVLERQFHRYYEEAVRRHGVSGDNLLRILEMRLDNLLYQRGVSAIRGRGGPRPPPPRLVNGTLARGSSMRESQVYHGVAGSPAPEPPSYEPQIEIEESTDDFARIIAAPLLHGFGITLGNALRRVLLSSLSGAAVTSVRIDGVQHEFSTIPNVKEDTIEFLLNVKGLRLRALDDRPGTLVLDVSGPAGGSTGAA